MIIVTENPSKWNLNLEGITAFTPQQYIYGDKFQKKNSVKVINLCNSFQVGSVGLHISALAESRGHKVIPEVHSVINYNYKKLSYTFAAHDQSLVDELLQEIQGNTLDLEIYLGSVEDPRFTKIGVILYNLVQLPVFRASMKKTDKWSVNEIKALDQEELSPLQWKFFQQSIEFFINGKKIISKNFLQKKFELAILVNPDDPTPPSNAGAIQKFIKAADEIGFNSELINVNDFGKIRKFDALFIRETTRINHHTFSFAVKAQQEGLVVIDSPDAILKCNNRIWLARMLMQQQALSHRLSIIEKSNLEEEIEKFGYPLIIRNPVRLLEDDRPEIIEGVADLDKVANKPDIVIAEEVVYPDAAWRVGIFNQDIMFAGKYYVESNMFPYQISSIYEPWKVDEIPVEVTVAAFKVSDILGPGLYALDIFEKKNKIYIMDIFDNPDINAGKEDQIQPNNMYMNIIRHIYKRCNQLEPEE